MAPSLGAEVLSGVLKHRKAVMCLTEKTYVLGKLCLNVSYNAVGYEFNVGRSKIYIRQSVFKLKYT